MGSFVGVYAFICVSLCPSINIKPTSVYEPYLIQSTGVQSLWMSYSYLTETIGYQDNVPITGCQATCPIHFSQTSLWLLMILQAFWLGLPVSSTHRPQSNTTRLQWNGSYVADYIFSCMFLKEYFWILIHISLNCFFMRPSDNEFT